MNRSTIHQFFIPFGDEPKSFRRMVITVQLIVLASALAILSFVTNFYIMLGLAVLVAATLLLSIRGITWPGQIATPLAITVVSTIFMLEGSGTHDTGIIGLVGSVIVAGLLLGLHGLTAFGILAIVIFLGMGISEVTGIFVPPVPAVTTPEEIVISPLILLALVLALRTLISRLGQIVANVRDHRVVRAIA